MTVQHDFPVDSDLQEMLYNDNPASLAGLLHEVDRFYETNGYFQPLITHGAVLLSNDYNQNSKDLEGKNEYLFHIQADFKLLL